MVLPLAAAVPWILGGLSSIAAGWGIKKGYDAKNNYDRAEEMVSDAQCLYEKAKKRLDKSKSKANASLEELGKLRIEVESKQMPRFIEVVKQVNCISYKSIANSSKSVMVSAPELAEMEMSSYQAAEILKDGIGAVSSGVLAGIGASGLASSLGVVAGTGTAIGSLSGVAATNATLAWLGGGSLAAGGMGMAGGTAILGGAIAGPAIALMGFAAASKSERALTEAFEHEAEIQNCVEQFENGTALLVALKERSEEVRVVILELSKKFTKILSECEKMVFDKSQIKHEIQSKWNEANFIVKACRSLLGRKPIDPLSFNNFTADEKNAYTLLNLFGSALYKIMSVKLLEDDGSVSDDSVATAAEARAVMRESGSV